MERPGPLTTDRAPVPEPAPARAGGLREAAVRGVAWQAVSFLGGKVLLLLATAILARLLTPEEFGLVAFALVVITLADVIGDFGVAQALVYLPLDRRRTDAALVTAVAVSGLLVLLAFVTAPAVAAFFGRAEVEPLLRVLSCTVLLGAVASVPEALLRRALLFRRTVGAGLAKAATTGGVSIALAVGGAGPWSLVWGQLAGLIVFNVVLWSLVDHRPDWRVWRLRWADASPLVRYGVSVAVAMLLSKLVFDVDYVVVGRMLGTEPLGLYTMAYRLPELAIISSYFVISAVAFPAFSQAKDDPPRLRRGYLSLVRLQSAFGAAAGVGLAVLAPSIVLALLGPDWEASATPLTALALFAALRSLSTGANDVYKAVGRPGLATWIALARLATLTPALVVAARWGIDGVAWAQAVMAVPFVFVAQGLAARIIGVSAREIGGAMRPALVAGAGVGLATGAVRLLPLGSPWLDLLLGIPAGVLGALLALRLLMPGFVAELRRLLSGAREA